ncbi:hypothetical protein GGR51DRAFT_531356 [Nemania sp. FL0031]|nr:hypothetical protein GGR51DRAFT_531356 [Nemania sp. FL0031]
MSADGHVYQPTTENISEPAFKIILWVLTGLCTVTFGLRLIVRFATFRYFLAEDYIVAFAWAILISIAVLLQLFLGDIYQTQRVENGIEVPTAEFPSVLLSGLRVDGIVLILDTIGIWSIKFSFLLFFRRFGRQIQSYMNCWYVAVAITAAAGIAHIGLIPYQCIFTGFVQLLGKCSSTSTIGHIYRQYIGSVVIDIASDVAIVCFPIGIVWRTKLNLKQKAVLTGVFLLVSFTIAVTVIRGSIFGGVYKSLSEVENRKVINTSWILFWFVIEYTVSFIIACVISFQSLWARKEAKERDKKIEAEKQQRIIMAQQDFIKARGMRPRLRRLQDSLLTTFANLEGTTPVRHDSNFIEIESHLGQMSVDFSEWDSSRQTQSRVDPENNPGSTSSMIDRH